MDFSIPDDVPLEIRLLLEKLAVDFHDGYLTDKGYMKKRNEILNPNITNCNESTHSTSNTEFSNNPLRNVNSNTNTNTGTNTNSDIVSDDFFHPSHRVSQSIDGSSNIPSTFYTDELLEKYHNLNSHYELNIRKELQKPLDPRDVSFYTENKNECDNLAMILRKRAKLYEKEPAVLIVDSKGKESKVITWDKLYYRAEKIAKQIKHKAALYPGDRVCLIYQNVEVIDFMVAFYGCLLSGVVAVPLNSSIPSKELVSVMNDTQSHLCLMSDSVFKYFEKQAKIKKTSILPKGMVVWKTSDMGTYKPSKKDGDPPLKKSDLAYIDFTRTPTGELRGVVMSHNTVMNQMKMLNSMLSTAPGMKLPLIRSTITPRRTMNNILSTLDVRNSLGLIISMLFSVYTGNLFIWMFSKTAETPGLLANTLSTYRTSILLADYYTLKNVVYDYESYPLNTINFNKRKVDISSLNWCLIDTNTNDCEFNEHLSARWLKPLGNPNSSRIVSPVLSLSEHGGAIIAMRDWFGKEDQLGCIFNNQSRLKISDEFSDDDFTDKLSEVLIDKVSLSTNSVQIIDDQPPSLLSERNKTNLNYVRVGAFGYPVLDATLALVNPETKILSGVLEVGEIWVDSNCISGGYWGVPEETETIFQAECSDYEGILNLKFVRTGLLGFIFNGKIYVLGMYEDRINQRVTWYDQYLEMNVDNNPIPNTPGRTKSIVSSDSNNRKSIIKSSDDRLELTKNNSKNFVYKYHYSSHLAHTIAKSVEYFKDCAFFNVRVNNESVPVAIMELSSMTENTPAARVELQIMLTEAMNILEKEHNLRLFFLMVSKPNSLSRTLKSGRLEVANTLTKRRFLEGRLPSVYVTFKPYNSLGTISHGDDIIGGIWSSYSSESRKQVLSHADYQISGTDIKDATVDERSHIDLAEFTNITKLLEYRANKQPDELAFAQIEGLILKETKQLATWKKIENKVFSLCAYILEKKLLNAGDYVILFYSLSEEYIVCLFACWLAGFIVIPFPTFSKEPKSLDEDIETFVSVIKEFKVKAIFVSNETENILKSKPASSKLKTMALKLKVTLPKLRNTSKHAKTSSMGKSTYKKMELYRKSAKSLNCMIWIIRSADVAYKSVAVTHDKLMKMCLSVKETCQLNGISPLIGCADFTFGLGFLQSSILGIYLGTVTYLMSGAQYLCYPSTFFQAVERYRIENIYMTGRMLTYAIDKNELSKNPKQKTNLKVIKNLMLSWETNRADPLLLEKYKENFIVNNVRPKAISHIYNHVLNPLVSTRSLLSFEPVVLWLDPQGLSQGYISIVNPKDYPGSIPVTDSGIVSVNTEVIIVNPQTRELCKVGEFGEIWVSSKFTLSFAGDDNNAINNDLTSGEFEGKKGIYIRSGDFGFLHNVTKSFSNNKVVDINLLYNLGKIEESFDYCGLQYFAKDIEDCMESFDGIQRACVFKAGEYTVLIVATSTVRSLSTVTPLMILKLLNKFKVVIDIISFIEPTGLLISKNGNLQRKAIARKWMNNTLKTKDTFGVSYGENEMIKAVKMQEWVEDRLSK